MSKIFARRLAVFLASCIAASLIGVVSHLPTAEAQTSGASSATEPVELVSERTDDTKVWLEPDGTLTSEIASSDIHYKEGGTWKEIDTALVRSNDSRVAYEASSTEFDLTFDSTLDATAAVSIANNGESVGYHAVFADGDAQPVVEDNEISYEGVTVNTDVEFAVQPNGVKESIVLEAAPADALSYRFRLTLGGVTPQLASDGTVTFVDVEGNPAFHMPAPWMADSSQEQQSGQGARSYAIDVAIDDSGSAPVLVITPDYAWLTAPERVYPIVIDPTTYIGGGDAGEVTGDTYVEIGDSTPNSDENALKIGTDDGGTTKRRSIVRFDISSLKSDDISVLDADFALHQTYGATCADRGTEVFRITETINEGWWMSSVNWSGQPLTAGTPAATTGENKGFSTNCSDGYVTWSGNSDSPDQMAAVVKNWVNESWDNNGLLIRATNEADNSARRNFRSEESAEPYYPRLWVNYNAAPSLPQLVGPAGNSSLGHSQPMLSSTFGDHETGYNEYRLYDPAGVLVASGHGEPVGPLDSVQQSNWVPRRDGGAAGTTDSWKLPTGVDFLPDGEYQWQARGFDGSLRSDWTGKRSVRIDTLAEAPTMWSAPYSPSPSTEALFDFTGEPDEQGATFECQLIRPNQLAPGYSPCTSPATYDLSTSGSGSYTFTVRLTDGVGNVSQETQTAFVHDPAAPAPPSIESGPGAPTADSTPEFSFTGAAGATFECELRAEEQVAEPYAPCTSPQVYDLGTPEEGSSYEFAVRQSVGAVTSAPATGWFDYSTVEGNDSLDPLNEDSLTPQTGTYSVPAPAEDCELWHDMDPEQHPSPTSCVMLASNTIETQVASEQMLEQAGLDAAVESLRSGRTVHMSTGAAWLCSNGGCWVWKSKHKYVFYWDGYNVWVAPRWGYNEGYHRCGYSQATGFTVEKISCWKTNDPTNYGRSSTRIKLGYHFRVHFLFQGIPISSSQELWTNVYPNGKAFVHAAA
jgi:hypothetical protein